MPRFPLRATFGTFFAVRGTHLAAMVAYFALASIVPLVFLALALLGLFGRVDESSSSSRTSPISSSRSLTEIERRPRGPGQRPHLGILGAVFLLWSSLSLFSALESAFNIVYGRPNRPFSAARRSRSGTWVRRSSLFAGLVVGTFGSDVMGRYAPDAIGNRLGGGDDRRLRARALRLPPLRVLPSHQRAGHPSRGHPGRDRGRRRPRARAPGAAALRPRLERHPRPAGSRATFLLLIWLYVLANVIVFGAALNWQLAYGRTGREVEAKRSEGQEPASA